jgi:CRP-like cAMP-binding protein
MAEGGHMSNPYYQVESYRDGDVIVQEGDRSREMYVIQSGQVVVTRGGNNGNPSSVETLERGEYFGEMSLFQSVLRDATVRAKGPTKLLVLEPGALLLKLRRDPTFAFDMLQRMSGKIRELEEKLSKTTDALV